MAPPLCFKLTLYSRPPAERLAGFQSVIRAVSPHRVTFRPCCSVMDKKLTGTSGNQPHASDHSLVHSPPGRVAGHRPAGEGGGQGQRHPTGAGLALYSGRDRGHHDSGKLGRERADRRRQPVAQADSARGMAARRSRTATAMPISRPGWWDRRRPFRSSRANWACPAGRTSSSANSTDPAATAG